MTDPGEAALAAQAPPAPVLCRQAWRDALAAGRGRGPGSDALVSARLGGRGGLDVRPGPLRPASVLVALVDHPGQPSVILTRRTAHLAHHAGQIAFPGGRAEPFDASAEATALREAHEEIGLDGARVDILGRLDDYVTITGFLVTPVVGVVVPPVVPTPDPHEVDIVFEVPLAHVLDPANHGQETGVRGGVRRATHVLPYGDHRIWGATAAILVNLCEVAPENAASGGILLP
ncbi:CoA pyrophosphatase [Pararhodospirillum oryzae]|uniref:Coenzyme A pyrophosphatase n=1 Tax=Pararhodospirillum oryzae TaxID=478448 RepID=A0A512H8Y4_9PROT|nr:CoA pyrophosphatase [Pararhodospirillum oryzae]GEO81919.1 coenzyme A pyrophosphatase [Pararhodospirillum oryzae]